MSPLPTPSKLGATFVAMAAIAGIADAASPAAVIETHLAAFRETAHRLSAAHHRLSATTANSKRSGRSGDDEEPWKTNIFAPICKPCEIPSCGEFSNIAVVPEYMCAALQTSVTAAQQAMLKGNGCPWDDTARPLVCSAFVAEAVGNCGEQAVAAIAPHITTFTQQSCMKLAMHCTEAVPSVADIIGGCKQFPPEADPCEPCWEASCGEASGAVLPRSKCAAAGQLVTIFGAAFGGPAAPATCAWDPARKAICGQLFRDAIPLCPNPSYNVGSGATMTKEDCTALAKCSADPAATTPEAVEAQCAAMPPVELGCAFCQISGVTPDGGSGGIVVPGSVCASATSATNDYFANKGIAAKGDACPWDAAAPAMRAQVLIEGAKACNSAPPAGMAAWTEATCLAFGNSCLDTPPAGLAATCAAGGSPVSVDDIVNSAEGAAPRAPRAVSGGGGGGDSTGQQAASAASTSSTSSTPSNSDHTVAIVAGITGSLLGVAMIVAGTVIVVHRRSNRGMAAASAGVTILADQESQVSSV
jgi:hypothetical protein